MFVYTTLGEIRDVMKVNLFCLCSLGFTKSGEIVDVIEELRIIRVNITALFCLSGWPRTLENRENRENGEKKFPAGKNQGI